MAARTRNIVMLGGPNGAGKTTAAQVLVPIAYGVREFVNADEIARGLSPFNPDGAALAAGRLMLRRIDELLARGESFAFETTCAGRAHALWLREARAQGWRLTFIYLWLSSPELAKRRVAQRVRAGGHAIPDEVIARRWRGGLKNALRLYLHLANEVMILDNSEGQFVRVADRTTEGPIQVRDSRRWSYLWKVIDEDDR